MEPQNDPIEKRGFLIMRKAFFEGEFVVRIITYRIYVAGSMDTIRKGQEVFSMRLRVWS